MKRKRSKSRVVFDVLSIISEEEHCTVSVILRRANVSYSTFKEIEENLLKKDLISIKTNGNGKNIYSITKNGRDFLKEWRKFKRLMEMYGFEP
ncbi:putative transcriptional regulator [Aciduliprofundum sp. MAR08-339]|uniref:winged helix-turn-helix domain-containing protein n=1 Tax=Aciduliprofundum sp. (strain MAR08-339) TaxID=673860 RepID=UPI0002A49A93|nr:putative transcriptional regulator [Aciduliprofundum sp. MAR08-339]